MTKTKRLAFAPLPSLLDISRAKSNSIALLGDHAF